MADTLRADHLGMYGYPRDTSPVLDALAAEARIYRRAVSAAPWTSPSMASLFTGLYPSAHGLTAYEETSSGATASVLAQRLTTLAEAFGAAGYATLGVSSNPWVSRQVGFDQGFDSFVHLEATDGNYPHAFEVDEAALEQLRAETSGRPVFLYLHYMDPHEPYELPESEEDSGAVSVTGPLGQYPEDVAGELEAYDRAIRSMDRQIGLLVDRLRASGFYDAAIVAFVADHGQQFREHGFLGHGASVHVEETWVPLWIRADGLRGVEERTVSTVDLYPTLLALAGLSVPQGVQGAPIMEPVHRSAGALSEGIFRARGPNRRALVSPDGLRLILEFPGRPPDPTPRHESVVGVFDPAEDPTEQTPARDHPRTAELVEDFYGIYSESLGLRGEVPRTTLSTDASGRLRALGYVE